MLLINSGNRFVFFKFSELKGSIIGGSNFSETRHRFLSTRSVGSGKSNAWFFFICTVEEKHNLRKLFSHVLYSLHNYFPILWLGIPVWYLAFHWNFHLAVVTPSVPADLFYYYYSFMVIFWMGRKLFPPFNLFCWAIVTHTVHTYTENIFW